MTVLDQDELDALRADLDPPGRSAAEDLDLTSAERTFRRSLSDMERPLGLFLSVGGSIVDGAVGLAGAAKAAAIEVVGPEVTGTALRGCAYVIELRRPGGELAGFVGVEPLLAFAIVERAFGGSGAVADEEVVQFAPPSRSTLTDIERQVTHPVAAKIAEELGATLQGVSPMRAEVLPGALAPELPADCTSLVLSRITASLSGEEGSVIVVLLPELVRGVAGAPAVEAAKPYVDWLAGSVGRSRVTARCELGRVQITLGALLALRPGDTLRLDTGNSDRVPLFVENVAKFSGQPVESHGAFGILIETELS